MMICPICGKEVPENEQCSCVASNNSGHRREFLPYIIMAVFTALGIILYACTA